MIKLGTSLALVLALTACGGKASPTPTNTTSSAPMEVTQRCAEETAAFKTWLAVNADPNQKLDAPWPTGDAAFDAELDQWRAHLRERLKPADPGAPAEPLASGVMPGPYDKEIASCEPAKAATKAVSEAGGIEGRVAAWPKLADALAACNCQPSVSHVKAHVYIIERGPN